MTMVGNAEVTGGNCVEPDARIKPKAFTLVELGGSTLEFTGIRCEDCPGKNDNPPESSDCPYFYVPPEQGSRPICKRDDKLRPPPSIIPDAMD